MTTHHKKIYQKDQHDDKKHHPKLLPVKKILSHPSVNKHIQDLPFLIGFIIVVGSITALSIFFIFIKMNEEFAANFADNTLRPLVGEQATLTAEAIFFAIEDRFNQIQYHSKAVHTVAAAEVAPKNSFVASISAEKQQPHQSFPIAPIIHDGALPAEGLWMPLITSNVGNLIEKTTYRPDVQRPYAITTIVKMNMQFLKLGAVAGTQQPGGKYRSGPGRIPDDIQQSNDLLAAFNGGFQQKDGYYGMIVGDTTYLPLEKDMATLVIYKNASPRIIHYVGQSLGENILAIRQNGPMLLEDGKIVTSSKAWNMQTWGLTTTNSMYTWRSGLGVTKDGDLLYVCGPSLVPETLASALLAGGAVNAMQMDINPIWVRFNLFTPLGNGQYSSLSLNPSMVNGGYQYLHGYQKDFFYVYKE